MKCLLVQTADRRRFLTSVRNLQALSDFCRKLGATALIVEVPKRLKLMSLEELASAVCDPYRKPDSFDYRVVSGNARAARKDRDASISKVVASAGKQLAAGKAVSVAKLAVRHGVTGSTALSCLRKAASSFGKNRRLVKTAPGEYKLS